MATRKISLTLDEDTLARVRSLTDARGVSAFVDDAVRAKLEAHGRRQTLIEALDVLDRSQPPTAAEAAAGERWADALDRRYR